MEQVKGIIALAPTPGVGIVTALKDFYKPKTIFRMDILDSSDMAELEEQVLSYSDQWFMFDCVTKNTSEKVFSTLCKIVRAKFNCIIICKDTESFIFLSKIGFIEGTPE